jgi:hypothetical protein
MNVTFLNTKCYPIFALYTPNPTQRLAIRLVDDEGFPICNPTLALKSYTPAKDEVLIKSYSENEGVYEAMVSANIIQLAHDEIKLEYVSIPICKLTPEFIQWGLTNSTLFRKFWNNN